MQVRDGRVTVTKADNGKGYTITALDNATMERLKQGKERSQVIMSMDMRHWEHFCTRVRPEDCLMSHRPPAYIPGQPRTPHAGLALSRIASSCPCLGTAPRGASAGGCIWTSAPQATGRLSTSPGNPARPTQVWQFAASSCHGSFRAQQPD